MIKTQSLRDDIKLAAVVSVALVAATACESRPAPTETTTLAATPSTPTTTSTAPQPGAAAATPAEPPLATDAERADHAAWAKTAGQELEKLQEDDGQWAVPGKNYAVTRYSTLKEITAANVGGLKVAWSMSTGTDKGHEGAPLVIGSTMYAHSSFPNHVFAIDLTKPEKPVKWKYTPEQDERATPVACCDLVHRGLNYADGKILMITLDAQVIALDAKTGKEAWKTRNGDPTKGETMTGSGLVVNGSFLVVI